MRKTWLIALLAMGAAFGRSALAVDACSSCGGSGRLPCPAHRAPTAFEVKHSAFLEYTCCLGTGLRLCTKCRSPAAAEKFEKRRAELREWVSSRRENVDMALFRDEPSLSDLAASGSIRHCETENFRLINTADSQPVMMKDVPEGLFKGLPTKSESKRIFAPEHWDWIILKRFEEEFAAYKEVFRQEGRFSSAATSQVEDACKVADGLYDIFIWKQVPAHLVCGRKFFGVSNELGTYKHGIRMTVAVGSQPGTKDDEPFRRYLLHMGHHLFIEAYDKVISFDMPAWVPEGFAHFMEFRRFGDFRICCQFERPEPVKIPGRPAESVLKLASGGKPLPAASIIQMNFNRMDAAAHLQMWSYFHYMIEGTERATFIKFIRDLKRTKDQLESFKGAYGWSLIGLDDPWAKWVKEKYK